MASIKDQVRVAFTHDGKDHVNVSPFAATNTGKLAFPEWRKDFYIPHLGEFASPRAFANWVVSGGNEELRHKTGYVEFKVNDLEEFRYLMLYAKFFQLTSLALSLAKEKRLLDVPWLMYKRHLTGVREFHRWESYPGVVKKFVEHIINNDPSVKFDFDSVVPGLTEVVNRNIRAFVGPEFVGIENIDKLLETKRREKQERLARKQRDAEMRAAEAQQSSQGRGQTAAVTIIDESGFTVAPAAEAEVMVPVPEEQPTPEPKAEAESQSTTNESVEEPAAA